MTTFLYVFCEGCGKEVDSSSYPEKVSLCETCEVTGKLNTSTSEYLALSPQPSNNMASTLNITPEQIKTHRATRKAAGLAGCISGRPVPEMDLFGYKDVQSWRPADPMNPHCFCFDCRDLWDNDASLDVQLLKEGNKMAMSTYSELLPAEAPPATRTMTEHPEAYARGVPREVFFPPAQGLWVDTTGPTFHSFEEVPTSLPAPRHRDIMNETQKERLKGDLAELRGRIQGDLVRTIDKRRLGVYYDEPERSEYLYDVDEEERMLWVKLDAVELLLKD
jgi:hypothetical protein